MTEKYLMLDLNDENSQEIAEIMTNKTCKLILNFLVEKDGSETDISRDLKLPLNTIDYNVKKLLKNGLIEKTKDYFWSVRGKKIPMYKIANKKILISTKPRFKGILPAMLISGLVAVGIRQFVNYFNSKPILLDSGVASSFVEKSANFASTSVAGISSVSDIANDSVRFVSEKSNEGFFSMILNNNPVWAWFLFGALFGILVLWALNLRNLKGGKN